METTYNPPPPYKRCTLFTLFTLGKIYPLCQMFIACLKSKICIKEIWKYSIDVLFNERLYLLFLT